MLTPQSALFNPYIQSISVAHAHAHPHLRVQISEINIRFHKLHPDILRNASVCESERESEGASHCVNTERSCSQGV